jgi:hypothetical protein
VEQIYLLLGVPVAICLSLALAVAVVLRRLASGRTTLPVTPEWINDLSIERYRPMLRLLDEEDLQSLASQPGFDRNKLRQIRAERCGIFREYLRSLSSDFSRVCTAIEVLMVQSQHDRPDLASVLIRQKASFALALVGVNFRLALYRWGICTVNVASLVDVFDSARLELRCLVPATAFTEA